MCANEKEILLASTGDQVSDHQAMSLLDVVVTDLDKRVGVCYGSVDEVRRFESYIFGSASSAEGK